MEPAKDLREYWEDRYAIVQQLAVLLIEDPETGLRTRARQIGVAPYTLTALIRGEREISFITWCKLKKYMSTLEKKKK